MKNIANADRPKSVGAMLPPRPFRGSGKVAQTACNSDRREGKSCIPTVNQTFADSRILKISKFRTFRIAVASLGSPIRLLHGDYRVLLGEHRFPPAHRIVAFLAPPWADALSAETGLDLSRTKPPVAEIIDNIERIYPTNPIIY